MPMMMITWILHTGKLQNLSVNQLVYMTKANQLILVKICSLAVILHVPMMMLHNSHTQRIT